MGPHEQVKVGTWGTWGQCSEPCDGGMQLRFRKCIGPKDICVTKLSEKRLCNTKKCEFARKTEGGVTYFDVNQGFCNSVNISECRKIAESHKVPMLNIKNHDLALFPL